MPAQVKAFFDSCGSLCATGALVGKTGGLFFSTGTQGGGQETTASTAVTFLAHQGMTYIPLEYRGKGWSTWTRCTVALRALALWLRVAVLASRRSWSWPWPPRRASPSPK
ncbi:hypothetical protein PC116_g4785 [Phytophthora cactorum]|nr:hypothetical protein PC112_g9063 [Phytophthora cactorum]KAG2858895.1 hypothetical protein PC113_g9418 [Phytophthora cactorum]KAG2945181.1 hypothetical protein PC117_g8680 [Phytophthora cactorum]KAG3037156.1 hypothetical protein PC119_g3864 [Phytophthora cactorum]KAG4247466.1 hypothetical protein PC116_g4785 [Phytophthora cactorum]